MATIIKMLLGAKIEKIFYLLYLCRHILKKIVMISVENLQVEFGGFTLFDDVSFVTKKISIGNDNEGTITLVGPTRMDYDRIVNALEYLAKKIDEIYNKENERKEQSDEG